MPEKLITSDFHPSLSEQQRLNMNQNIKVLSSEVHTVVFWGQGSKALDTREGRVLISLGMAGTPKQQGICRADPYQAMRRFRRLGPMLLLRSWAGGEVAWRESMAAANRWQDYPPLGRKKK